ncbi:hypothetical protein B0T24DRAFT_506982, partial [Lasiosphaeria ovina]
RRKYEEIERQYACRWNGCEKAYGTLSHLNVHVINKNHGKRREPKEFEETRKILQARKQQEEGTRKADEERQ